MPTWAAMDRIKHNPPQPSPAPHRGRGEPPAPGEGPPHPLAPQGTPRAPIRPQTLGPGGCKGHCCPLVAQGWGQRGQPGCDTRSWGRDPSGHPAGRRGRERSRAPPAVIGGKKMQKMGKKESVQHAGGVERGWRGGPHGKGMEIGVPVVCRAHAGCWVCSAPPCSPARPIPCAASRSLQTLSQARSFMGNKGDSSFMGNKSNPPPPRGR